jgi:hypothetical protein
MNTAEQSIPRFIPYETETANENLKRYKSPNTDQILAELIKADDKTLHSDIHILINCM